METTLARHVAIAGFRTRRELTDMLELLRLYCDSTEYAEYEKAVAAVDERIDALLTTIFSAHADVKKDIGASAGKYGEAI
jgi:hypothetical protein